MSAEPTSRVNQKTSDLSYSLMGSVQAGLPMSDEAIEAGGLTAQELEMLKRFNSKRREELMLCLFISGRLHFPPIRYSATVAIVHSILMVVIQIFVTLRKGVLRCLQLRSIASRRLKIKAPRLSVRAFYWLSCSDGL